MLAVATLVLWLLASAEGAWYWKVLATLAGIAVIFGSIHATGTGRGWPTTDPFPKNAILQWCVIRTPSVGGDPGAVTLWATPINASRGWPGAYDPTPGTPRAYQLPYDEVLAAECFQANKAIAQEAAQGQSSQIAVKKGKRTGTSGEPGRLRMYKLPPPREPRKGTP